MGKGKIRDFLVASKDQVVNTVIESDKLPSMVEAIADIVVSEGTAEIIATMVGSCIPQVNGIWLNYKQARFESSVQEALMVMAHKMDTMEANYELLNEEIQEKFRGLYVEWLLDNLEVEKQKEKIPYHVNGFINLMTNDANDNLMLMFFETINQLTQLDIDVLKMYSVEAHDDIYTLCERYKLKVEHIRVIKEKLERLGLVYCKNDEKRDSNIDEIVDYLNKVDKEKRKSKPRDIRLPNIKKPNRSMSYAITPLGRDYLKVISAQEQISE